MNNIILIGMAGCGKSTTGVLLAKSLGIGFLDTDLIIQQRENMKLQEIINKKGLEYFKKAEETALLSVNTKNTVIATGGSAVYYDDAMKHLKENGICVWLSLPFCEIEHRIKNIKTRGIAIGPGKTLYDVYNERQPLYKKYADIIVDCRDNIEENISKITEQIKYRRTV